jgi:2-dehydropantoate 2-reductase
MKVAVVGCGALGSFYGAKLFQAGQDVHFLLRSDYEVVRDQGVRVRSIDGDFHARPKCARRAEEIGVCDLVLIGLKTTANGEFPRLIPPLVGPATVLITLQNGLGNEEALAALVGPDNVLGGLCFVCLNRVQPGLIVHTAHGKIVLGEFQRRPTERTLKLARLFREAAVPCEISENLAAAHWEKLVWNIPFNGLGVAGSAGYECVVEGRRPSQAAIGPVLPTDRLLDSGPWENLVRALMLEVVSAARARGHAIDNSVIDQQIERTRVMQAYKASTLLDFERGYPLELESMFREPLRQARQAGVETPRLAALCGVLEDLERAQAEGTQEGSGA